MFRLAVAGTQKEAGTITHDLIRAAILLILVTAAAVAVYAFTPDPPEPEDRLRPLYSREELHGAVVSGGWISLGAYQERNVPQSDGQMAGAGEPALAVNNGDYVYLATNGRLKVMLAYPPEQAAILTPAPLAEGVRGLLFNDNTLAVIADGWQSEPARADRSRPPYYSSTWTKVAAYDVSDRSAPRFLHEHLVEGAYLTARIAGSYVYLLVESPATRYNSRKDASEMLLPRTAFGDAAVEMPVSDIFYPGLKDHYDRYLTVLAIDLVDESAAPARLTVLLGNQSTVLATPNSVYLTYTPYDERRQGMPPYETSIYRVRLDGLTLEPDGSARVPGRVLSRFSVDKHGGYLRLATTDRPPGDAPWYYYPTLNTLYVLDGAMNVAGALFDIDPGERIRSARFSGDRAYLRTSRKAEPFSVIDLSDPSRPRELGKLKITGYSDYLHPYEESYLLGIGKETEAEEGYFRWDEGIKVSLFDASDVANPREIAAYAIGDRGTDSPTFEDYGTVLLDRSRGVLVLPVLEAEIDPVAYRYGVPSWADGEAVWQGAYVLDLSTGGLALRGRIVHQEEPRPLSRWVDETAQWVSPVRSSFLVKDALYTISGLTMKVNDLNTMALLKEIELG